MGAVVEIWFESLIPFLLKDSHIVHCWAVHFKRGRHSLGHGFDLLVLWHLQIDGASSRSIERHFFLYIFCFRIENLLYQDLRFREGDEKQK